MTSLSEFSKNFKPKPKENLKTQEELQQKINQNLNKQQQEKIQEDISSKYQNLKDKDQNELMSELFKEGQKLKANGQFNYDNLYQSIQNMSGMISEEQKETMINLLNKLR